MSVKGSSRPAILTVIVVVLILVFPDSSTFSAKFSPIAPIWFDVSVLRSAMPVLKFWITEIVVA